MTARVCARAGCGKGFLSVVPWHVFCSPACEGGAYVLVAPTGGRSYLLPGEHDVPGTYYVTFDLNPTVVLGAPDAAEAVRRASTQLGIIYYPRWPHVMGPPVPPPVPPPPVPTPPPRPPRRKLEPPPRRRLEPKKPDAPVPWEALPARVREGVRAALAERAALAKHGLAWGRDSYAAITDAIAAERLRLAR